MDKYAPIVVTVYDRPIHFMKCIEALQMNAEAKESDLFIVSDAASSDAHFENVEKVRRYAETINGFGSVNLIFRPENLGAFDSMNLARNEVVNDFGRLITMEDDIIVARNFLRFMNQALDKYESRKDIFSVCGYIDDFVPEDYDSDVLLLQRFSTWGLGVWKNKWNRARDYIFNPISAADMEDKKIVDKIVGIKRNILSGCMEDSRGRIKATDVRLFVYMLKNEMFCLYPRKSLVKNIGMDGSGLHLDTRKNGKVDIFWDMAGNFEMDKNIEADSAVVNASREYCNKGCSYYIKTFLDSLGLMYFVLDMRRYIKRKKLKRSKYRI